MRKVFILNDGGHDYTDAERFGKVVLCTKGVLPRWDIAQMYRELESALLDAAQNDYILISSLSTLCSVATAIMVSKFGEVHFLIYKDGQYLPRDLVLEQLQ